MMETIAIASFDIFRTALAIYAIKQTIDAFLIICGDFQTLADMQPAYLAIHSVGYGTLHLSVLILLRYPIATPEAAYVFVVSTTAFFSGIRIQQIFPLSRCYP